MGLPILSGMAEALKLSNDDRMKVLDDQKTEKAKRRKRKAKSKHRGEEQHQRKAWVISKNWFIPMVQNQRMKAHPPEPERVGPGRSFLTLVVKRAVPVRSLVSVAHWTIPEPVIGTAL